VETDRARGGSQRAVAGPQVGALDRALAFDLEVGPPRTECRRDPGELQPHGETAAGDASAGDYTRAAAAFVDYWSGAGAWAALRPSVQAALICWVPKAPLDFRALIEEPTPVAAYADLRMPVLIMRGEHAPKPTHTIAEILSTVLPETGLVVVDGAGHMGPLTHGTVVSELIAAHIGAAETVIRQSRGGRSRAAMIAGRNGCRSPGPCRDLPDAPLPALLPGSDV